VLVSPSATQQFALIAHELATNALKYGALSVPQGRVSIQGKVERVNGTGQLLFIWKESGGPPASAPSRKGFGSVILMDVAKQWAGEVSADFSDDGLTYSLRIPLNLIEATLKKESGHALGTPANPSIGAATEATDSAGPMRHAASAKESPA
jgi:two-component sensor histidine kinase